MQLERQKITRCLQMGVPIALQNAMVSVSMIYLQRTANLFGDRVIAAYTATMRIEQFVQQPFSSLNMGMSSFAGQNVGAGKRDRVIRGYHQGLKIAMLFVVVIVSCYTLLVWDICWSGRQPV